MSANDYGIIQPTGLTGSISPAVTPPPPAPPPPSGPSAAIRAAQTAAAQLESNFVAPQFGVNPQVIDTGPTIEVMDVSNGRPIPTGSPGGSSTSAGDSFIAGTETPISVDVSSKVGANGTLTVENGGMRLPDRTAVRIE
jgi:hypothetical protein